PAEVVKVGQKVQITVMEVDLQRNRIGLSMKSNPDLAHPQSRGNSNGNQNRRPQQNRRRENPTPTGNDWFTQAMSNAKKK
ncbi:MAG: RNA-binding transcriptional accessory protein, partial [Luteolibacter sp.]